MTLCFCDVYGFSLFEVKDIHYLFYMTLTLCTK